MKSLSTLTLPLFLFACVTVPEDPAQSDGQASSQDLQDVTNSQAQAGELEDPNQVEANFLRDMGVEPPPAPEPEVTEEPEPEPQNPEQVADAIEEVQAAVAKPKVNEGVTYPATPDQLSLWKDPEFKRRFAESYLADSETTPPMKDEERLVLIEVRDLLGEDETEEAIELLLKEAGDDTTAIFDYFLANIYVQEGRLEEAMGAYRVAVNRYPKYRLAWNNLGRLYVQDGRFVEAAEAFTKVIELGGGSGEMYGLLGYSWAKQNSQLAAETAYRMAVLMEPTRADWKIGLARCLFEQRQFPACIAMCETLIEESPDRHELWLMQGEAYSRSGQGVEAAKNFEMVDRMGHASAGSLIAIADIYAREGLYDLASQNFVRALAMDPKTAEARALRGAKYLVGMGAYEWADGVVTEMEKHGDEHFSIKTRKDMLGLRAALAVELGDPDAEIEILEKSLELDPTDGRTLIQIGRYKERNDDLESAIFYFERAAQLDGYEGEAAIAHGQSLVRAKRYKEGLKKLKEGQKLKPSDRLSRYIETVERLAKRNS